MLFRSLIFSNNNIYVSWMVDRASATLEPFSFTNWYLNQWSHIFSPFWKGSNLLFFSFCRFSVTVLHTVHEVHEYHDNIIQTKLWHKMGNIVSLYFWMVWIYYFFIDVFVCARFINNLQRSFNIYLTPLKLKVEVITCISENLC